MTADEYANEHAAMAKEIAKLRARLALAERVVEAAGLVAAWGCPSSCDGEEHDWDALTAALAAWKEGES